ncbi:uncharacterized protein A1O9_06556 [Exophiala aquamarina CBS 119918]|uniref:Nitroreductase domain-containing protein n=1 Tax=Exophiala aquamarina CBS 119918 TaxID=1182545 RepID=A0A072PSY5_9EURO|nr:uncharacterized protein A1O9_06556 [Exophiala aquamarina CBS 119918]KEF58630.1 hypothetical protein A1O9_06556 [Exophiala aquamarina CBS 119918]
MADKFLDAVKDRKSLYKLKAESPIPDSKIQEIVEVAIMHSPSTYNVQSARAVILFGEQSAKLWDIALKHMEPALAGSPMKDHVVSRIALHRASKGTVLWFEDQNALDALGEKSPMIKPLLEEWSNHSSGIHQFVAWAALEAEGLGANLQHYNFHPGFVAEVASTFDLPDPAIWKPKSQLVFGTPTGDREYPRAYEPLDKRVLVKA